MPSETVAVLEATLVLASASPRRRQLLDVIGLPFRVVPADVDEIPRKGEEPASFARRAAWEKAIAVSRGHLGSPVLGADTVVEIDGKILGKPESERDAEEMLRSLSGRDHRVHTALTLVRNGSTRETLDTATVSFLPVSDSTIRWYVNTGEPMDKAGAYAVQGIGGLLVESVKGSPHTVIGLPIHRLPELFEAHDLDFWTQLNPVDR